ncbi:MAG: AlpA family phage regulatory protein [Planctomycetota bacterium]|nr:MAG: AlpA family phage regulatory protein [Planctomycetota bacterium]
MESLVVRAKELAKLLSVSLVHIRRMDSAGKLPKPIRLGGCVSWRRGEIEAWILAGTPNREKWQAIQTASKRGAK